VDDEDIIRLSSRRLLEKLGYQVLTAENGETASLIYKKNKDNISLVMLDIIMPIMDGAETFFALRNINPQVKVLLFSGYSNDEKVDLMLDNGAVGFLQKPFDLNTLSNVLKKALS
jgi:DNA-binding NtrC family response regulator